jgi:glycosyltransferase involved in cell wall biosynthesis
VKFNIGGSGEEYEELTKYVETNSLKEYVEFLGWVDNENKENILMKNQVFVLPSYNEGLPIAILEALSYGMPIISTNVGSIDEAVYNERNGYLLQPGNIEELKNKLAILINNFEIRKKMGVESRKIAKEKFDEKEYYKELVKLYKGEKNGKYS